MRFAAFILLTLTFFAPTSLTAQDQATIEAPQDFKQDLTLLKSKLETNQTLGEEAKQQTATLIKSAEASLEQVQSLDERISQHDIAAAAAERQATDRIEDLAKLTKTEVKPVDESVELTKLESEATATERSVEQLKVKLTALETKIARRNDERQKLNAALDAQSERLAKTQEALQALPAENGSLLANAKRLDLETKEKLIRLEANAITAELKRFEAEDAVNLLRHQRDLESLRLEREEKRLTALQKVVAAKRQTKAQQLAAAAKTKQKAMEEKFPLLAKSFQRNTKIAERGQAVEKQLQKVTEKRDALKNQLEALKDLQRVTKNRVKAIGLTGTVGAMLRKRRVELTEQIPNKFDTEQVKTNLDEIQFEIFEKEEERNELDVDYVRKEIETENSVALTEEDLKELLTPINELIVARKEKLVAVDDGLDLLFDRQIEVQSLESKLHKLNGQFREYINERILWIRSNDVLFSKLEIDESDMAVFSVERWSKAMGKVWGVIQRWPLAYCLSSLVILLMLMFKSRMRNEVDRLGIEAAKGSCVTFWPTTQTLFWSVLIAITIPLIPLMMGLGIYLSSPTEESLFDSIGTGLLAMAWFALPMEILRRMCRPKGLANMHFDWADKSVNTLKTNLDWMILPSALLVFAIVLLHNLDVAHKVDLTERIVFVVALAVLGWFLFRTFNPTNGIFASYLKANEKSWANQTSLLWMGFILLIPLTLAILTIWGYYYTALNLASYLYATFVFALIVETIRAMMRRLILLSRRRVHIQAARRKRELQIEAQKEAIKAKEEAERALAAAKAEAKEDGSEIDTSTLPAPATTPIPSVESLIELRPDDDIDDNAIRATKLIGLVMLVVWAIGLWMIWTDVLPALKALDNVTLWTTNEATQIVAEGSTDAPKAESTVTPMGPSADVSTSTESTVQAADQKRVTVRDLLKFIVIALLTLVSARNLPAAIEMLFLDHLPVDRSFRYATKALTSYAIIMLGMVLAFRALSISWDNVQWLATALTFGLAFGLQEIFANFVAGIILMFERPIRIGDWITVDEFTGVVTKIRTRATTIVNWDRKEYVIPNKDFITGRLINWTLSDAINRIVINVGVAYGSDVVKAKKILMEVCSSHPKTVADPGTVVAFQEFADSSLNLVVRTFLADVESRVSVIDDLHTQINQAFIDAGIEISFPQRDLHIRSIDPTAADTMGTK